MLYVFYGSDTFSRREALERLKRDLDQEGMLATNTLVLAARQTTPQEIIAACGAVPFLGSHRLVIVEGLLQQAAQSSGGRRSRRRTSEPDDGLGPWQALVDSIGRMPETTTLVIVDGDVAGKNALLEALRPLGHVVEFRALSDKALPDWIQKRAQSIGLKIDGRAVRLLAELVGGQKMAERQQSDLWSLANELDKLSAYANGDVIREDDVRGLTAAAREQKGYSLADAVVEGRPAAAARLLHELLAQDEFPAVLLSTIAGRYRRLAIVRDRLDAGASGRSIQQRFGLGDYALERLLEQASRYSMAGLRAAFARLLEADVAVKRGIYDEKLSLEMLAHDLASVSRAA